MLKDLQVEQLAVIIEAHRTRSEHDLRLMLREAWREKRLSVAEYFRDRHHAVPSTAAFALAEKLLALPSFSVVTWGDADYPRRIAATMGSEAPPLLYCQGNLELLRRPSFAIIGTRRPTACGRRAARAYARYCAGGGWVVVSGNAIGVDATAHASALEAGGATIVFPPTPLDVFEPSFALAEDAWDRVIVASRYLPGSSVTPWYFLGRNQLVAALCYGGLVAETGTRGGTLDTVGHLKRLQRPLFITELPPEAKHRRAFELLRASGAWPVPIDPTPEFVASLLAQIATQEEEPPAAESEAPDLFETKEYS